MTYEGRSLSKLGYYNYNFSVEGYTLLLIIIIIIIIILDFTAHTMVV